MSGKETTYQEMYEHLSSEEQKKHKSPDEIFKALTETKPIKDAIGITGLMLRNEGEYIIVEVEINGKWHQVFKEYSGKIEAAFSHIAEPDGIRRVISQGKPL
jgi:hypothetical protein